MKQFIINLTVFAILASAIIYGLTCMDGVNDDYSLIYDVKCEQLQKIESPKLVLMGGSSVPLGYDTKKLADSLHINAYNFGVTSQFGNKYIVEDMHRFMKAGDILVLSLEYVSFLNEGVENGCETEMCELLRYNKHVNWDDISLAQIKVGVTGLPLICKKNVMSAINPSDEQQYFVYKKSGFNEYGDEVSHWILPSKQVQPTRNTDFAKYDIDRDFTKYYISKLIEMQDAGVKVVVLPGMMGASEYEQERGYIQRFLQFWKENGGGFDGKVTDYVVPDECLQDVCFHMNKMGVDRITKASIRDIRRIMETL